MEAGFLIWNGIVQVQCFSMTLEEVLVTFPPDYQKIFFPYIPGKIWEHFKDSPHMAFVW